MALSASHLRPSHPCTQSPPSCGDNHQLHLQPSAMMTFKEEPLDEEVDSQPKRLMIDLTPSSDSSQPGLRALQLKAGSKSYPDLHLQTSQYSDLKGSYPRYHPYPRPALGTHSQPVMVSGDFCKGNAAGTLLHPVMGGGGGAGGGEGSRGVELSNGFGSGDTRPAAIDPRNEATTRASRDTANILAESFHRFDDFSGSTDGMSLGCGNGSSSSINNIGNTSQPRARREFVPEHKKDGQYWSKRHKNNMSARRSRVKRKNMEKRMEHEMLDLQAENRELRLELEKLQKMFGLPVGSKDLASSPARSPESSSLSSSSSSGIGTSISGSSSSGGSAEHSASTSPALGADEEKAKSKPLGHQLKAAVKETGDGEGLLNGKSLERQLYNAAYGVSVQAHPAPAAVVSLSAAVFPASGDPDSISALTYPPADPHAIPAAMLDQAKSVPPPAHFNQFSRQFSQQDPDCHSMPRNSPPAAHGARGQSGSGAYLSSTFAKNSSPMYSASAQESFALYAGSLHRSSNSDRNPSILSTPLLQKNSPDDSSPTSPSSFSSSSSSSPSSSSSRYARVAFNCSPAPCIAVPRGNSSSTTICASGMNLANHPALPSFNHPALPSFNQFVPEGPARAPHRQSLSSDTSSDGSCSSYFEPDFSADASDLQDHADLRERYSFSFRNSPGGQESGSDSGSGASQGGSPGQVSEDDNASSASGESRRSSRSSTEEPECLHKIPLKCRIKRELHSAFSTSNLRRVK